MSQGKSNERQAQELDLGKEAVKDITPATETVVQDPIDPAPAAQQSAEVPPPSASRPEVREKSSGALPVAAGAVAGALFGLVGAVVYQNVQRPPVTVADPRVAAVEAGIAAVERKTVEAGQIEQRLLAQIKAVDDKIAALDQRAATIAEQAAALDKRAGTIDQKTVAAEQKAVAAEQRATAVESRAATLIAPVDDRLKAAEARLSEAGNQATALAKRVDLLAQIEPPKVDLKPIISKIEEMEKTVASSTARVTLSGETMLTLDGRVKAVEQSVKGFDGTAKAAEAAIKGLETSVADLKMGKPAESAAAVLAVSALARRALDQSEPMGPLATALGALGAAAPNVAALAPYAQTPAPNPAALATLFEELAKKTKAAAPPPAPASDGIVGRVTSGLWSQVDVRPVGNAPAGEAVALAGKVRQAVLSGDLAGAHALVAGLPADQQAVLKPFSDAVSTRIAALNALRAIEKDALAIAARKG
jgi:hypothetical protein